MEAPALPAEANFLRQAYTHGFRRDSLLALGLLGGGVPPFGDGALRLPGGESDHGKENPLPQIWGVDGYEIKHFLAPPPRWRPAGAFARTGAWFSPAAATVRAGLGCSAPRPVESAVGGYHHFVDRQVEPGTDGTRIRAEMENPTLPSRRLRPGTYADLRLYPETAPERVSGRASSTKPEA